MPSGRRRTCMMQKDIGHPRSLGQKVARLTGAPFRYHMGQFARREISETVHLLLNAFWKTTVASASSSAASSRKASSVMMCGHSSAAQPPSVSWCIRRPISATAIGQHVLAPSPTQATCPASATADVIGWRLACT